MTRYLGPVVNHWRCGLDEGHSLDEVKADFSCVVFFQSQAWGFRIDYNNFYVSINGNKASGSNASIRIGSGQTADVGCLRHNVTVYRTHSDQDIWVEGQFNNTSGYMGGSSTAGGWVRVPKKSNWAVTYNANGGSGAPGNQTKWYGEDLTLQAAQPVRTGHNFAGWATAASGPVAYYPSGRYTNNSAVNLYAKWNPHTYTVSYNANGGSGAPGNQTKTYGQNLTLSSVRPYRQNYNFKGWATSPSGGVAYQPGSTYSGNSGVTLYAVWELAWFEPRVTNLQATRCDSAGTLNEEGQYAKVTFNWATDRAMTEVKITCNGQSYYPYKEGGATNGNVAIVIGNNGLSTENQYPVIIYIRDTVGDVSVTSVVPPMNYIIDVKSGGRGVSFGRPSTEDGVDIAWPLMPRIGTYLTTSLHGENGAYGPWVKLGTWDNVYSQGSVAIVRIYGGEGQNGDPSQNTTMTVFIKKGFTGAGDGLFFGTHVIVENATEHSNIQFKVIQENDHKCTLWWYSKWHYDQFSVSTECTHGSIWTNAQQDDWSASEPTGKTCRTDVEFIPTYNRIFPVGSIVIRYDHTSPASLYGGTWLRLAGRFLYPAGANEAIGGTGGSGTHTLTVDQMPSHVHNFSHSFTVSGGGSGSSGIPGGQSGWGSYAPADWFRMGYSGGNKPHNNNPAYINVSVWRRTE